MILKAGFRKFVDSTPAIQISYLCYLRLPKVNKNFKAKTKDGRMISNILDFVMVKNNLHNLRHADEEAHDRFLFKLFKEFNFCPPPYFPQTIKGVDSPPLTFSSIFSGGNLQVSIKVGGHDPVAQLRGHLLLGNGSRHELSGRPGVRLLQFLRQGRTERQSLHLPRRELQTGSPQFAWTLQKRALDVQPQEVQTHQDWLDKGRRIAGVPAEQGQHSGRKADDCSCLSQRSLRDTRSSTL